MLKNLCNTFAPSGQETKMRTNIKNLIGSDFGSIETDNIGNLIAKRGDSSQKLCIECGMDSCGIMVISKLQDKAYFSGVGGVSAGYLVDKAVLFENGEFGIIRYDGVKIADAKVTDLYIEMDTKNIEIGDFGVIAAEYREDSNKFFGNDLSSKVAILAVIKAINEAKNDKSFSVAFTAQRRFAAKGIQTVFCDNEFKRVITVDGISCESGVKSGDGCAIVAVDKLGVSDKKFRTQIEEISKNNGIKFQTAVTNDSLCIDTVSTSGKGTSCVAIGIPVSHKGKTQESILKADFDEAVKLIKAIIEEL